MNILIQELLKNLVGFCDKLLEGFYFYTCVYKAEVEQKYNIEFKGDLKEYTILP